MFNHATMVNHTQCIEQLFRLGLWEGAEQTFDGFYADWLTYAGMEKAEILADWYRSRLAQYQAAQ